MPSEVHLTRAQKWDLARLAVAAVASTVFFSLPIFLVRAGSADVAEATSPSVRVSEEIAIASVSMPETASSSSEAEAPTPHPADAAVVVVTSTKVAKISRPVVATSGRTLARPVQVRARAEAPSTPVQPPTLSRRLARLIAGNGKYGPKPFPSVGTSGM